MMKQTNFKCEDCGGDKFTFNDRVAKGNYELTLFCAGKDCEASYSFRADIKLSCSSHPTKICKCNQGFLDRNTRFCSGCGKKNPNFKGFKKKK